MRSFCTGCPPCLAWLSYWIELETGFSLKSQETGKAEDERDAERSGNSEMKLVRVDK